MKASGKGWMAKTRSVFCAVTAVIALVPNTPRASKVFKSACIPALPPESDPPMVSTAGGCPGLVDIIPQYQYTQHLLRLYQELNRMQQASGNFRLIVRRGPQPNQVHEMNKDVITLGRDITNDITINDPEVSRHHARLTRGGGGY